MTPKKITAPAARRSKGAETIESDDREVKTAIRFCSEIVSSSGLLKMPTLVLISEKNIIILLEKEEEEVPSKV
ncbi:MAG: hypothetical protein ACE5RF_03015 [Nitrosarchaeum sp.]